MFGSCSDVGGGKARLKVEASIKFDPETRATAMESGRRYHVSVFNSEVRIETKDSRTVYAALSFSLEAFRRLAAEVEQQAAERRGRVVGDLYKRP